MSVCEKLCGIYCIENSTNGKKYIGQSIDVERRWKEHRRELNSCTHNNKYLQRSWDVHGEENFTFNIIELCQESDLDEREVFYISKYNTMDSSCGYNLESGGNKNKIIARDTYGENNGFYGKHHSEDTKMLLSSQRKEKYIGEGNPMYGKCMSDSAKQKISKAMSGRYVGDKSPNYGKHPSEESRKKMSGAKAGLYDGENHPMYGKHHTEESRHKISESRKGKYVGKDHKNSKSVYCCELGITFVSLQDAHDKVGVNMSSLCEHLKGRQKSAGKHPITGEPLHWIYANDVKSL